MFWEDRNGNCRVALPLAKKLCETVDTWRRFAAPVAEWVAQAIWNSSQNSAKGEQVLPTRLTQRRKSEGRGNTFTMRTNIFPHHPKICAECGVDGVTGRYCGACAAEVARRTIANIGSFRHMRPKRRKEKARLSRVLSNHAVANTWWDPSSLPSWLTEECYVEQVQPLLRTKKLREDSRGYPGIRALCRFDPFWQKATAWRHWESLSKLVAVSESTVNA